MKKLTSGQLNRVSDISGNISVAWFSAGVISPFLIHQENLLFALITAAFSLLLAGIFFLISLQFAEEVNI